MLSTFPCIVGNSKLFRRYNLISYSIIILLIQTLPNPSFPCLPFFTTCCPSPSSNKSRNESRQSTCQTGRKSESVGDFIAAASIEGSRIADR